MEKNPEKSTNISELAKKVLSLARDSIVVRYRFFDRSLAAIKLIEDDSLTSYVSDIGSLSYNPAKLLKDYKDDANFAARLLLHVIFPNVLCNLYKVVC